LDDDAEIVLLLLMSAIGEVKWTLIVCPSNFLWKTVASMMMIVS
jgi:hypothetical protein